MKNAFIKSGLTLLITGTLLFSVQGIYGQKQVTSESIIGTWIFDDQRSFAGLESDVKEYLDEKTDLKSKVFGSYEGRRLVFKPNGDFIQSLNDGRQITGSWYLENFNTLVLKSPNGGLFYQEIELRNTKRILLKYVSSNDSKCLVPNQYYSKL